MSELLIMNSLQIQTVQHVLDILQQCEPSQHAAKIVITYEMVAVDVS
jgi:hypothetical protein